MRVRDVRAKEKIIMREKKTGKEKKFPLNKVLKKSLVSYIEQKKDYEFLFRSRQGRNQPVSRQQAWKILREKWAEKYSGDNCYLCSNWLYRYILCIFWLFFIMYNAGRFCN